MRANAIWSVLVREVQDKYAPPSKAARISVVGDLALIDFVTIADDKAETETPVATITLDAGSLYNLLGVLIIDDRASARKDPL